MNPRLQFHLRTSARDPAEQSMALALESQRLGDTDRASVVYLARRLELPLRPLLQTWAELDAPAARRSP